MTRALLSVAIVLTLAAEGWAQNTSQVFGRVTDSSEAVLPGVTVTLTGQALLEPRVAVTSETGTYQFPGLPIGVYSVKFELAGFGTQVREGLNLEGGFNSQLNVTMPVGSLQEGVVVVGVNPIVDVRSTTQGARFNVEEIQAIPSARDVFHVLNQAPGIALDRQNVGGTINGQQTGMFSRGAANGQGRWFVDGVDQSAIAAGRPHSLDFNAVDEVQIATGGADVTMQTPGVTINIVTKTGSDIFRGATWGFFSHRNFGSYNVTDALRAEGASSGNPLLYLRDYGGQLGGPIKKGRAWFWGTYGIQNVRLGVLNYYKPTSDCAPVAASPLAYSFPDVVDCLNLSTQDVPAFGGKIGVRPFRGNQITASNAFGMRFESIRSSDDLHPFEATNRLTMVRRNDSAQDIGWRFWNHGAPMPHWRFADQQTITDRWFVDATFGHYCYCDVIAPQTEALRLVQPMLELSTGNWQRSHPSVRMEFLTNNALDLTTTYFVPGRLGGDHSVKAGFKYARYRALYDTVWSGDAQALFNSPRPQPLFSVPFTARINRNRASDSFLYQQSFYAQDTYSLKRLTLNLGFRWDRQDDEVAAANVTAHAFQGLPTLNGTPFALLPAINAPAVRAGVMWNTVAPRLGVTYDLTGNARNVIKASYALYFDQRSAGQLSTPLNPTGDASVDLGWTDLNGDSTVQANEVNQNLIRSVSGFDPASPSALVTANQVDPRIGAPRTDEIVVGFGKEMAGDIGINISYVWRKYGNFIWQDRIGLSSADYSPVTFAPPASVCPPSARCETVTYFVPNITLPSAYLLTNQPDFQRVYDGLELVLRKRSSRGWMLNGSLALNSTISHYESAAAYEDPTNIAQYNGAEFAPATGIGNGGGSNLAGIPVSAKWIVRVNGSYQLPWYAITLAATADVRQGYPFPQAINIASRPNRAPAVAVLLDQMGDVRLSTFRNLDFRLERPFAAGRMRLRSSLDVFNLFNANTVLGRRANQNALNANQVFGILGPRTVRMGLMVTF